MKYYAVQDHGHFFEGVFIFSERLQQKLKQLWTALYTLIQRNQTALHSFSHVFIESKA